MKLSQCNRCRLSKKRNKVVKGEGSNKSGLMLVGEAPGKDEDEVGRPFVGRSGALLRESIELFYEGEQKDIFITNVVKCRPTKVIDDKIKNRKPDDEEITICSKWLKLELEKIKPVFVITLGASAFNYFVPNESLKELRGKIVWSEKCGVFIYPVYHPSYILRKNLQEEFKKNLLKLGEFIHAPYLKAVVFLRDLMLDER